MKILVFSTAYYPFVGGAEVAIKEISDRLPEHEWHVITARMSRSLPKMERVFGVTVHRVGVGFKTVDKFLLPFLGARTARSLARSGSIDRIWGMMASQGSLGAAFFKRSVPTVPFVLTLQEGDEEAYLARYVGGSQILYKLFIRPWYRYIFKKADRVTVISRYLGDRARAALFSGPVDLVPNAVDLARFTPGAERTPDGRTVLVTTSRLVEKNAVGDIIAALVLLPKSVHLSVIGEGPLGSALRQQVQVLGLSDRVVFHGHKEHAEMIILLRQADIFIRPSLSEGLGISFLEAMAMRLPVVATLVGGIPDFLADGVTGVACKPHDPASIAMAVERLTGDSALRERIIENAQQMIQDRYDWNSIAREMEKSLEEATLLGRSVVIAAGIYPPHPGGPALHAKHYVEELPQMGIPTRLVAFSPLLGYPKGIRHGIYLWKLFWKALHSRAIFAQDISSAGYPAYLIARFLARPLFVRIGGDIAWESAAAVGGTQKSMLEWYASGEGVQSRLFPYGKKILGRAKRVMVPTELLRHVYRDYYGVPDAKIVVIPNPVDATQTRELERATPPGEKRTLLFASRLVAYKNLPFVIGSIARIQGSVPSFRFVICGDGPEFEALGKLVADRHLEEVVELWGRVSESEVALLTEEAWCTIAPAFTEFNPNFVLRGLASGVPFLISAENGLPFRVPEQFLFNARNGEQLDERLRCILSDKGHADAEQLLRELPALDSWATFLSKVVTFLRTP